jgi:FtsH-binding integral membrane protein
MRAGTCQPSLTVRVRRGRLYPGWMPTEPQRSVSRAERVLAFMSLTLVALSVLAILAVIIGTGFGAGENDGFSRGIWPVVIVLPAPGLILGLVLLLALLVVSWGRRGRENKRASR